MLFLLVALVLAPLAWLAIKRMQLAGPPSSGRLLRGAILGLGAALALRIAFAAPAPLRIALFALAIGAFVIWLRRRGQGGDGPDDGRDPPVDPGPDPSGERLDPDAFDRARDEWERTLRPG